MRAGSAGHLETVFGEVGIALHVELLLVHQGTVNARRHDEFRTVGCGWGAQAQSDQPGDERFDLDGPRAFDAHVDGGIVHQNRLTLFVPKEQVTFEGKVRSWIDEVICPNDTRLMDVDVAPAFVQVPLLSQECTHDVQFSRADQ